jgi:excisionase family DNA binding protein
LALRTMYSESDRGAGPMMKRESNVTRRLLRLKPAAEYLSVSPGTLRTLVQRGELPIIKLAENGRSPWLLDVHDLDNWVDRTKVML